MKKSLLLSGVAACGLAFAGTPALANQGVKLSLGGYASMYGAFVDQDETAGVDARDFDLLRDTQIHFTGETTLDNGLTVGAHFETEADGGDSLEVDESYLYFSGAWGRINLGAEDGAAYLLQVAAPSADDNIDGLRQYIQPVNYDLTPIGANPILDYAQDPTGSNDKITYLSPVLSGFQLGLSYSPDMGNARGLLGVREDDVAGSLGSAYEGAIRYEGMFNNVGVALGGGYSYVDLEANAAVVDDRNVWNLGVDLDIGPFGLGVIYKQDDHGHVVLPIAAGNVDRERVWVVGADYTTGPFKLGVSYYDSDIKFENGAGGDFETQRYTGGVVYTYGPGMTFRGSVSYVDHELRNGSDVDATSVLLGTVVNF